MALDDNDGSLRRYLRDASRFPLLDPDSEVACTRDLERATLLQRLTAVWLYGLTALGSAPRLQMVETALRGADNEALHQRMALLGMAGSEHDVAALDHIYTEIRRLLRRRLADLAAKRRRSRGCPQPEAGRLLAECEQRGGRCRQISRRLTRRRLARLLFTRAVWLQFRARAHPQRDAARYRPVAGRALVEAFGCSITELERALRILAERERLTRRAPPTCRAIAAAAGAPVGRVQAIVAWAGGIIEAGRRARGRMIEANLRLVVMVAGRHRCHGLSIADLVQEGNLGLIRAVDRYEWRRGVRFSTYAVWWIRQAMGRAITDRSRIVRTPGHVADDLQRLACIADQLAHEAGGEPGLDDLARAFAGERFAQDPKAVRQRVMRLLDLSASTDCESLDTPQLDDGQCLGDLLEEPADCRPEVIVERRCLREDLELALAQAGLSRRERLVLRAHFGLDSGTPQTLEAISVDQGIARAVAHRAEIRAFRKLRRRPTLDRLRPYLS